MKRTRESGEVVVEASIVVTIVVLFISVFLYLGMILYQQSLVSVMANQTASNIAQVYSNSIKDPFTGYVDPDSVYQSITYSSRKTDAYLDALTQKANTLAYYRLQSSRILTTGSPSVRVEIVKKPNELLKSQVVVTIQDQYELPLVSLFGVGNELSFTATGRADCVDILEYLNGVEAVGDPEHSSITYLPDSDTCLIQFFDNRVNNKLLATVPVLKGKSIMTSNYYTHSTMPSDPKSNKFDFIGWVKEDGSPFFATTEISNNISVYGTWECTITFEPEGGKVSPKSKKVQVWSVTDFPTPTRSGNWTFLSWNTKPNGGGVRYYSNSTVIDDNITLYAHWRCDHNYIVKSQTAGNCKTRSRTSYKCTQCGNVYEVNGSFGGHKWGSWVLATKATCLKREQWKRTCSICKATEKKDGNFGDHIGARCGKTHILGKNSYEMSGHSRDNGYTRTTRGECIVCKTCKKLMTVIDGQYVLAGGMWRNGQWVSVGMYCRGHNDNSGTDVSDSAYRDRPSTKLHGSE